MARVQRVVEVDAGQHREDVGLQSGDEELERHESNRHEKRQRSEDRQRTAGSQKATTKPAKTFSAMCPASMFAKRRKDSEIGRERNEMSSITTMKGRSQTGTPDGTKRPRKWVPCS